MTRKTLPTIFAIFIPLALLALAACTGSQPSATTQAADQPAAQGQAQGQPGFDPSQMTVEMKLAVGTLQLENTDLAVTADEAGQLLPLWKAVKSLSASDTAAQEEIQALYQQIQDSMTAEQVKHIQDMQMTNSDLQSLREKLGIQDFPGGGRGDLQDLDQDQIATRVAQFQAQNPGGGLPGGGGGGFQGGPPPDGGGFPGGAGGGFPGQGSTSSTPSAGQSNRRALGMNSMFIDPLIELLEERAGS